MELQDTKESVTNDDDTKDNDIDETQDTSVDSDTSDDDQPTLETLLKENALLKAEAIKQRQQKREIAKARDQLKAEKSQNDVKSTNSNEDKWKTLYEETNKRLDDISTKAKDSQISSAINEALNNEGVRNDAFKSATKLIDRSLIDFGDDDQLDVDSVKAATRLLKLESPFLFEDKIPANKTRQPKQSVSTGDNEYTREAYEALSVDAQRAAATKKGFKIVS